MAPPKRRTTSTWRKFRLLLWKNWLLQWRHKYELLFEILIPVLFCLVLVLFRSFAHPTDVTTTTYYKPLDLHSLEPLRLVVHAHWLCWPRAPNNSF